MLKSYIVNGQIRSLMNAEEYEPTEQEWIWAVADTEYFRKSMHYTFGELYLVVTPLNVPYWVPKMSSALIPLPNEISVDVRGSRNKDVITIHGVDYQGYDDAIMNVVGWKHPNRFNILRQFHVVEEFDWSQLKLITYQHMGNSALQPVFMYKGSRYQSVKTLAETFSLDSQEVKDKMGVKERHELLAERFVIMPTNDKRGVYFRRPVHQSNYEKSYYTVKDLISALRREKERVGNATAKKIMENVIKGSYTYI